MSFSYDNYIYGVITEYVEVRIYNAKTVSFVRL
jgi:hypothetical protein